ncbi:hypothetical protein LOK49_LG10G02208 [Camellia lanceoleosa]|uniref:Uncharacterized protein n=1 Tax=Camellia lanceoleosa TaxID=1840588 RepID=A0ACC0G9L4_9ERIC|nr:hypothetical protein LOK49_LG10G02208 [Camellia lanceoleosa]
MAGVSEQKKRKQPESNNSIPGNPFEIVNVSASTPVNTDSTELRISDDPKKLLALLAAFVGLFTNHSKDDVSSGSAGQDQDPPNKILANVALLLGLSAAAAANGDATPPVNGSIEHHGALRKDEEEEEEEDGYRQRSKKQRIILDSDAESIPDSSQCTPPPTKSEGSTGYSPDSIVSAASVANRSRITRSSDGKFQIFVKTTLPLSINLSSILLSKKHLIQSGRLCNRFFYRR